MFSGDGVVLSKLLIKNFPETFVAKFPNLTLLHYSFQHMEIF